MRLITRLASGGRPSDRSRSQAVRLNGKSWRQLGRAWQGLAGLGHAVITSAKQFLKTRENFLPVRMRGEVGRTPLWPFDQPCVRDIFPATGSTMAMPPPWLFTSPSKDNKDEIRKREREKKNETKRVLKTQLDATYKHHAAHINEEKKRKRNQERRTRNGKKTTIKN